MIRRINILRQVGRFTELRSDTGEPGNFAKLHVVYAHNATGDDHLASCQHLVADLTNVNEYSQRFHHRTTGATADAPDGRELLGYAEQTLSIIHR